MRDVPGRRRHRRPPLQLQLLPTLIPYVQFTVRLDPLSVFFGLIVSLLAFALSLYSLGYARGFYGRKNVGVLGAFFNLMLLATTLVVMADNAFFFLMVWEIMALSAYCLVSFEHEKPETRSAGVLYFVMSHIGTGCIMLGFLLLFQATGSYDFASFHALTKMPTGWPPARATPLFCSFSSASASRRASCRCTPGCRRRIRSRPATCPPSCPA